MQDGPAIAVIGLSCRYPGASTLREFWENVIARRCQFRRLPNERLPLSEYYSEDPATPDKTYAREAAVIDGFEFDWIGRGIPKPLFESGDIVHWLAMEVALTALEDAGHPMAQDLPKERTGVILGNTLTGEHTRANTMRLRWPFVAKTIRAAARDKALPSDMVEQLVAATGRYFKSVFAPTTEDTLAGGLSNTISGRICGYLGLNGGGYTVDGACSSSLIAVATAASALSDGTLDAALAGGVDVSLDTFELIGFSKAGALAKGDLHVYDRRANGFKPGEGCGFVVLKRLEDARADGDYVYAVLRGWGIASDGTRRVTAPSAEGQAKAIRRAYERVDYSPQDLDFVEGHGTGTAVGDAVELQGISLAMEGEVEPSPRSCGVTSLKSAVGHTKAAAGVGGLIKAVLAANRRVLPPTAGCTQPHPVFDGPARSLYPILQGEVRPASQRLRVGVSAAGFGGINCHVTLESGDAPAEHLAPEVGERALLVANQETELFVVSADSVPALIERVDEVRRLADGISHAEMVDLAAKLAGEQEPAHEVRAALIAEKPSELDELLAELSRMLAERPPQHGEILGNPPKTLWLGNQVNRSRVAFLFPGQGSQQINMGRTLVERYPWARRLVEQAAEWLRPFGLEGIKDLMFRPADRAEDEEQADAWAEDLKRTEVSQPAICLASLLWRKYLEKLGIEPVAVGGHSLGELSAFHAAGAYDDQELLRLAAVRGRAMAAPAGQAGTMASLACPPEIADQLVNGSRDDVVIANFNSFAQTVISGQRAAVEATVERASAKGIRARVLPVSNAFHSPYVADAARCLREQRVPSGALRTAGTRLFTSTDGTEVADGIALADHFADQVVSQVHFIAMVASMCGQCDVFVEVGPGRVLSGLVASICGADGPQCLPVESKPGRDRDLNTLAGCLFARGADLNLAALYDRRLVRDFVPASDRLFIDNPCERPFRVDGAAETILPAGGGAMEAMLAEQAGVSPQQLSDYLRRRGQFLAAVVRADLGTMAAPAATACLPPAAAAGGTAGLSSSVIQTGALPAAEPARPFGGALSCPTDGMSASDAAGPPAAVDASQESIYQMLLEAIEQITGFPPEAMSPEKRLIDDLNLDSIKAAELIASVSKRLGIAGQGDPAQFANATLQEIAEALAELAGSAGSGGEGGQGAKDKSKPTWVRNFVVEHVEEPQPTEVSPNASDWAGEKVLVLREDEENEVAEALKQRMARDGAEVHCRAFDSLAEEEPIGGSYTTMLAILPRCPRRRGSGEQRLQAATRRLQSIAGVPRSDDSTPSLKVAYVQFGGGDFGASSPEADVEQTCAKALAASLHLENDQWKVRVLDFAPDADSTTLADKVALELTTLEPFAAVGYDAAFVRRVPKLRRADPNTYTERGIDWSSDDVILVTGGAKGITAECALAVAEKTGVRMALVGSSPRPADESQDAKASQIAKTIDRFAEKGLTARYYQCNVADAQAVASLIAQVEQDLGPITGVVHGAAINKPRLLKDVTSHEAFDEVAPKVLGAANLCQALAGKPPKIFVALSSIIGVSGMWRNGWYGFSNEAMDRILGQFEAEHPETQVVTLAYSVWDEVGMGFRMGSTDYLASRGIGAISLDQGVRRFAELFDADAGQRQVVITARLAGLRDTVEFLEMPAVPVADRFLEEITFICPGVEVVARAHLNADQDVYLKDHVWKGSLLFPTVYGLEAMSQAVAYVTGNRQFSNVQIDDVRLERPIVVDPEKGTDIEIRAEVLERSSAGAPSRIKVGIATESTGFSAKHFAAEFVLDEEMEPGIEAIELPEEPLAIDPKQDLYGDLLFQGPRFQRLRQVRSLDSERGVFLSEIAVAESEVELLCDACFRDSLLHAVQVVMPQWSALPVSIERIRRYGLEDRRNRMLAVVVVNRGVSEGKATFTVTAVDEDGRVVEKLDGYTLAIVEQRPEYPTPEELANPSPRDERTLRRRLDDLSEAFHIQTPALRLAHQPGLHALAKDERHRKELPVLIETVRAAADGGCRWHDDSATREEQRIGWLKSGKPVIIGGGGSGAMDVSVSHDDELLLSVSGLGPQGCDVHQIQARSREDWIALLGNARSDLVDDLVAGGDSLDVAGTRIWTAVEAARKATGAREVELSIDRRLDGGVLLDGRTAQGEVSVMTFPAKLTLGPEKMFAVVAPDPTATTLPHRELHIPPSDQDGQPLRAVPRWRRWISKRAVAK